jgi:hypothetical protein
VTARQGALALLAMAALLYFGLARTQQGAAAAAADDYRRARNERLQTQKDLARAAAQAARRQRAHDIIAAHGTGKPTLSGVRRFVLDSLERYPVSAVQLELRSGQGPNPARVHVTAEGRLADLVAVSGHLTRVGSGLVLGRTQLTRGTGGDARLDLEAFALEHP